MTRRVVRLSVSAILAISAASATAQAPPFETTRIADGVYQFRWQGHNGFFVVTDAGVVAVDPISTEAAATYAAEINRAAPGKAYYRDLRGAVERAVREGWSEDRSLRGNAQFEEILRPKG